MCSRLSTFFEKSGNQAPALQLIAQQFLELVPADKHDSLLRFYRDQSRTLRPVSALPETRRQHYSAAISHSHRCCPTHESSVPPSFLISGSVLSDLVAEYRGPTRALHLG